MMRIRPVPFAAAFTLLATPAWGQESPATEPTTAAAVPSVGQSGSGQSKVVADAAGDPTYTLFNPAPLSGTISTGRPSFSTGTTAVPAGHFQLESGYLYSSDSADKRQTFPNFLLRVGLTDAVEARFATAGYVQNDRGEDGLTGVRAGAKIELLHQDEDGLSLAVQPSVLFPGADVPGGGKFDPLVQVSAGYSLPSGVGLVANASGAAVTDASGRQTAQFTYALLASYSPLEKLGLFAEYYAVYSDVGVSAQNADFGATYLLSDNTQVDVVLGVGLNSHATDFFVGAGYSFRF